MKIPNEFIDSLLARYKKYKIECNSYFYKDKRYIYFSNLDTVKKDWTLRLNLNTVKLEPYYEPDKYRNFKLSKEEALKRKEDILWHKKENKYLLEYVEAYVETN